MKNQEKKIKDLESEIKGFAQSETVYLEKIKQLEEKLKSSEKKILELEEDFNSPLDIPIDLLFDVLPENEAINTLSRLSAKLHGRITENLTRLRNETGLLENNLEIFELNAKNISLGRNFKKS